LATFFDGTDTATHYTKGIEVFMKSVIRFFACFGLMFAIAPAFADELDTIMKEEFERCASPQYRVAQTDVQAWAAIAKNANMDQNNDPEIYMSLGKANCKFGLLTLPSYKRFMKWLEENPEKKDPIQFLSEMIHKEEGHLDRELFLRSKAAALAQFYTDVVMASRGVEMQRVNRVPEDRIDGSLIVLKDSYPQLVEEFEGKHQNDKDLTFPNYLVEKAKDASKAAKVLTSFLKERPVRGVDDDAVVTDAKGDTKGKEIAKDGAASTRPADAHSDPRK
jgi:hypothetical protein